MPTLLHGTHILPGNQVDLRGGGSPEHRTGWLDNRNAIVLLLDGNRLALEEVLTSYGCYEEERMATA